MSQSSQSTEGRVHWTDKARRKVYSAERKPGKLGKPDKLWKKVVSKWKPKAWKAGLGLNTPSLRLAVKAAMAYLDSPTQECSEPGVVFALVEQNVALLDYWFASQREALAVRALLEVAQLNDSCDDLRLLARVGDDSFSQANNMEEKSWKHLRKLTLSAGNESYERAVRSAVDMRGQCPLVLRCGLSFAFPNQTEWAVTDALELGRNPPRTQWGSYVPESSWWVMHSLNDTAAIQAMLSNSSYMPKWVPWAVLGQTGPDAFELLKPRLAQLDNMVADQMKPLFETLSLIESREVAQFMANHLGKKLPKAVKSMVTNYFSAYPEVALEVLPGAGKEGVALAQTLARGDMELANKILLRLEPAARKSLESVLNKLGPVKAQARADEVPDLLISPPWKKPKSSKSQPKTLKLETLAWESTVDWRGRKAPRTYFYDRPPRDLDPKRVEKDLDRLRGQKSMNIFEIDRAVDEAALQFFEEAPAKVWSVYQDDLLPITSRFGVKGVTALIKLSKKRMDLAAEALTYIVAPEVAPFMADVRDKKRAAKSAELWFRLYPEVAVIGLIPVAVGKPGSSQQAALKALRSLEQNLVHQVADRYGDEARKAVDELLNVDPLTLYPSTIPKLPAFADPAALPPVLTASGNALPKEAVNNLLTMLAFSALAEPYAGVQEVAEVLDSSSVEEFTWELFQTWLRAGASTKEEWAFTALAHLGGDEGARRVTPFIRKWPGESAHQRAVLGLDILGQIGSDVALMNLYGIGQKLKYKALKARAREKVDQIAARRNLTRDELADRLVPDFGANDQGEVVLDFGTRQFVVSFDEMLRPVLTGDGKVLKNLPKPGKSDDADKAKDATKRWKALKKDLKQSARGQVLRLERAMTFRRSWSADQFQTFLVEQPLVFQLTRRLIWGQYEDGKLKATFRVAEDQTFANSNDDQVSAEGEIRLPHPLEIDKEETQKWKDLLSDYGLLQPFAQLTRQVYAPKDNETKESELERFSGKQVAYTSILGLEERGWERGEVWDSGVVVHYTKTFPAAHAELLFEPGLFLGSIRESGEQTLEKLVFYKGKKTAPLSELDPILFSELIIDLEAM
jgi:hypothetical protein